MIRRRRFDDVVRRQLDLFEREHGDLLDEIAAADREYGRSGRGEGEDAYARYDELVEAGTELLAELRDSYSKVVASAAVDEYEAAFDRGVRKRFRPLAVGIGDA